MFPLPQAVNPAVRSHLDSQLAFFNDVSRSLSGSFQSVCAANLKLSLAMFEETVSAGQRMLTSTHANDLFGAAASGAQPASDNLRAYQQHISRLAADAQADLARLTQQHGPETSRTAHALADEVTRVVQEEGDRNLRQKEEFVKNFRDPFQQEGAQRSSGGDRAAASPHAGREGAGASMQSDAPGVDAAFRGNAQGQAAPPVQGAGKKNGGMPK